MNQAIRILWQSSTAIENYPAYGQAVRSHARERCAEGTTVDLRGVANATTQLHFKAFDFLNNRGLFESALRAEREGYDAVAIGCFLDPVLDDLKEVLDIPVLGMAETAMHLACTLGRRFAVLSHNAALNTKFHADLIVKYGLERHAGPLVSFDLPFPEMEAALAGKPTSCLARIEQAGREAVAQGSEVILLGCGLMNLIAIRSGLTEIDGAPVLDVSGALLKATESMVVLRRTSGLRVSRKGYYERPPEDVIESVAGCYGLDLGPDRRNAAAKR